METSNNERTNKGEAVPTKDIKQSSKQWQRGTSNLTYHFILCRGNCLNESPNPLLKGLGVWFGAGD